MGLTVVTLTRDLDSPYLDRCKSSVKAALIDDCKHRVIVCSDRKDFNLIRFESALCDEFVTFVDDDDTITKDALELTLTWVKRHNADIAFTDEDLLWETSNIITSGKRGRRTYREISCSPTAAHHLLIYRTSKIHPICLDLANEFTVGIDWIMTNSCLNSGTAIHIQTPLYTWTQRPGQKSKDNRDVFNSRFIEMKKAMRDIWSISDGLIPVI